MMYDKSPEIKIDNVQASEDSQKVQHDDDHLPSQTSMFKTCVETQEISNILRVRAISI
jgi:hypothetical protein